MKKSKRGISLIVLVIMIIVVIILAATVILTMSKNNPITSAREAKFKAELTSLKQSLELFKIQKSSQNTEGFNGTSLNASKNGLYYEPDIGINKGTIKDVFPDMSKEFEESIEIIKGEMVFSSQNKQKLIWAQEVEVQINPYNIVDGVLLSSNTNLMLLGEDGTLVIPSTVNKIAQGAFASVDGIKKIVIPSTVKEIQKNAFNGCTGIEEVVFETRIENGKEIGTEKIGEYAFGNCTNLVSIELPNTVMDLGKNSFTNCRNLSKVVLSNNITTISAQTFSACIGLKQITIPEGVGTISSEVFLSCHNLQSIKLPKSLTYINTNAFNYCNSLNNIEIAEGNINFTFSENILFNKEKTRMIYILPSAISSSETTFKVPSTVTILGSGLISNFPQLQKVVIPASVTNIDDFRFFTRNITQIEIDENNPTYMADGVGIYNKDKTKLYLYYQNAKNVTNIELDNNITTLDQYAFILCSNLKSLTIGEKVSSIGWSWTWNLYLSKLTTVKIDAENKNYMSEGNGIYNKEKTKLIGVFGMVTEFTIPYGVTEIGKVAFYKQEKLTQITIPNTVTTIKENAFSTCIILPRIEIPGSVTSIENDCFKNCSKLEEIRINKKKDSIPGAPWGAIIGDRAIIWKD